MVERKEVEALLAACEMIREHELDPVNHSPIVPAPELAALCRAWLAVQEAPVRMVGDGISYGVSAAGTGIKNGTRVRLVPVGEGEV